MELATQQLRRCATFKNQVAQWSLVIKDMHD
jgi:hypothetical protein